METVLTPVSIPVGFALLIGVGLTVFIVMTIGAFVGRIRFGGSRAARNNFTPGSLTYAAAMGMVLLGFFGSIITVVASLGAK